ncbi:MAG: nitrite/sulfite reductase [Dehalococcoidia bacterium]
MATLAGTKGVIPIIPEETDEFERETKRFRAGEWDPNRFIAWRVMRGVYGQRQLDAQMFRVKIPYGGLTAEQIEALGIIARDIAPLKKGHFTTRENMQFHHITLEETARAMGILAEVGLTGRESGGNSVRNVTGCPLAGVCSDEIFDVTPYAAAFTRHFVRHPMAQKLPRKFKTTFSGCVRDCAMTGINDIGFIPVVKNGQRGFKMVVGGGLSIMPRVAPTLYEFVSVDDYLRTSEAVVRIFDRCDELRKNKMKARLKFYVDRIGIDEFRQQVEEELKQEWAQVSFDPTPLLYVDEEEQDAPNPATFGNGSREPNGHKDQEFQGWFHSNVSPQRQPGYNAVLIKVPLGDVAADQFPVLADIARKYAGGRARTTHHQNLMLRWVPDSALYEVWKDLGSIGMGEAGADGISDVTSCPGTDSCKLGITSSMGLGWELRKTVMQLSNSDPLVRDVRIKISGCPNSCGQHHIAPIGFHGRSMKGPNEHQVPAYEMFIGGACGAGDTRIGQRLAAKIPAKRVPQALLGVLDFYKRERQDGEEFNRFVDRVGFKPFEEIASRFKEVGPLGRDTIDLYTDWARTVLYKVERGEGECSV